MELPTQNVIDQRSDLFGSASVSSWHTLPVEAVLQSRQNYPQLRTPIGWRRDAYGPLDQHPPQNGFSASNGGSPASPSHADFKQRLLSDPKAALSEMGIELPEGMENVTLKVVENTADTTHLVLPAPLPEGELDDETLDGVAGGLSATRHPSHFLTHAWLLGSAAFLWSAPRSELLFRALYHDPSER